MSFDAEYRGLQRREERLDEIFGNGKARVNRNFSTGDLIRRFVEVVKACVGVKCDLFSAFFHVVLHCVTFCKARVVDLSRGVPVLRNRL